MRYHVGPASIDLSDELRDETLYAFRDADAEEALELSFEERESSSTVVTLLERKIAKLSLVYGERIGFEPVETAASGAVAAEVTATVGEPGPVTTHMAYVEMVAAGIPGPVFVQWTGPLPHRDRFRQILRSMSVHDDGPAPAPGLVRRWAGRLALDVPSSYTAPRAFRFSGHGILLEFFVEDAWRWEAPAAPDVAPVDKGRLELAQSDGPSDVSRGAIRGREGSWVFVRRDEGGALAERYCVRQLVLGVGSSSFVRLRGTTSGASWLRLTEIWADLLGQLQSLGGP